MWVLIMYKLKIKDMVYTIPKENICALAISKFFDIGGRLQSDLNTQEGAIEYLKSLGVEIQEDNQ